MLTGLLAIGAAGLAGALVRSTARAGRSARLWWVAATGGGGAALAVAASGAPVPVGSALVGAGLAAAAVVDGVEGRVPTPVAWATVGAAAGSLVAHALSSTDAGASARAVGLTALLVAGCAALWLAGSMGFGDVRLAAGTTTAMLGGASALVLLGWVALFGAGLLALRRRIVRRRGSGVHERAGVAGTSAVAVAAGAHPVPFAPPLAVAWLLAVVVA